MSQRRARERRKLAASEAIALGVASNRPPTRITGYALRPTEAPVETLRMAILVPSGCSVAQSEGHERGDALVPQIAEWLGLRILEWEAEHGGQ